MMTPEDRKQLIDDLRAAIGEKAAEADKIIRELQADVKTFGTEQNARKEAMANLNTEVQKLATQLNTLELKLAESQLQVPRGGPNGEKSLGQQFIESDVVEGFKQLGSQWKGRTKPFAVKTITSLPASGGAGIWSDRRPEVITPPLMPLSIRALIGQGTTNSNLIEWVQENVFTNAADVVSEGTTKPESNITYTNVDVPVRTVAHWIRATRQVLADFPQLRTQIDTRLVYGLKLAEENQILLGDGTGNNILGLIPQATAYNDALNRAGDTFIDVIRHAILQVALAYYPADGIVLTPTDWHNIELTKDNENRYILAQPHGVSPAVLWGRPVAESYGLPNDQFLVGNFRLAATLFDREQASVMVSTEDQDNFVTNRVTILAEERLALAVTRPQAFVHGNFPADSTTGGP